MQTYAVFPVCEQGKLLSLVKTFEIVIYYNYLIIRYLFVIMGLKKQFAKVVKIVEFRIHKLFRISRGKNTIFCLVYPIVYAKNHDDIPENCDMKKMKKILLDKCEECKFLVIDIPKNILRYKP